MKRKIELLFLLTIIFFVCTLEYSVYYINHSYNGITNPDFWSQVIQMRQIDFEQRLNFDTSWSNIFRLNGTYEFYPPGFTLILNNARELTGINFMDVSYLSIIFWVFFCILIYLLAKKITNNSYIGFIASFCGSLFISGTNMHGPMNILPSSYGNILILLIFLTLAVVNDDLIKFIFCTIFVFSIFITHRPTAVIWLTIVVIISVIMLPFVKNKQNFFHTFQTPLIFSTLIGGLMSFFFWYNAPVETIMRLGGIISKRFDVMIFGIEMTKEQILGLIIAIFMLLTILYLVRKKPIFQSKELGPLPSKKIKSHQWVLLMLGIPMILGVLLLVTIFTIGVDIPTSPSGFVTLWEVISSEAKETSFITLLKQIMYAWHINLLPLVIIVPSVYLVISKVRRNYLMLSAVLSLSMFLIFLIVGEYYVDVKLQRTYIYLAPFISILVGWGTINLLREKHQIKKIVIILVVASIALSFYSIQYNIDREMPDNIEGIYWESTTNSIHGPMATTYMGAVQGRGIGQIDFTVQYPLLIINNHYELVVTLKNNGFSGVELPPPQWHLRKTISGNSASLIYIRSYCSIWAI
ncbi:MAG: hypothetical protein HZB92_08215 [Euryarchaeota archaeon]|nr:hypothetical protein [Euryarchaeota archaeon]